MLFGCIPGQLFAARTETNSLSGGQDGGDPCSVPLSGWEKMSYGGVSYGGGLWTATTVQNGTLNLKLNIYCCTATYLY